jgi:hypothetical protein
LCSGSTLSIFFLALDFFFAIGPPPQYGYEIQVGLICRRIERCGFETQF